MKDLGKYYPPVDLQHEAAEALHHAMSLYKAAGSRKDVVIDVIENLWESWKPAKPVYAFANVNGVNINDYHGEYPLHLVVGDVLLIMGKERYVIEKDGYYSPSIGKAPERVWANACG